MCQGRIIFEAIKLSLPAFSVPQKKRDSESLEYHEMQVGKNFHVTAILLVAWGPLNLHRWIYTPNHNTGKSGSRGQVVSKLDSGPGIYRELACRRNM